MAEDAVQQSALGKEIAYPAHYDPKLLFAISRQENRDKLGISAQTLPFHGQDIWNAYELSWLNPQGKPVVALASWMLDCRSSHIIESKSVKLYLNSLANHVFSDLAAIQETLNRDLSAAANFPIEVTITLADAADTTKHCIPVGICLDSLDITTDIYHVTPALLKLGDERVENQCMYSHLLKSNCLVTQQPDWATVHITYSGRQIQPESLLQYIISYRNHNGFHEHCVENIFMDMLQHCKPDALTVYARYTRRGGIDINPYRSTEANVTYENQSWFRQ